MKITAIQEVFEEVVQNDYSGIDSPFEKDPVTGRYVHWGVRGAFKYFEKGYNAAKGK